ncbi:MAG TPA: SDR family NAD(P)-dependent oxidoreductase [Acidimicrobiales bacterium]
MSRRVLITGASSGIGAALAAELTARGDEVAICARRTDRLALVPAAHRFTVDLADLDGIVPFARQVEQAMGRVDVLVNNAGAPRRRSTTVLTVDELDETMRVNFTSAVHLTLALLPGMIERRSGLVVNVSSMGTRSAAARVGAYAAAKGALNLFTEALWFDLAGTGVRAKLFIPGSTATEFSTDKPGNDPPFPQDPRYVQQPDEVARALAAFIDADNDDFEGYANPAHQQQTAQKYADHNAFLAAYKARLAGVSDRRA